MRAWALERLEDRLAPAAGALDPSFGDGGKVTTDFGGVDEAQSIAVQRDGKIVAAGGNLGFTLARYRRDGSLDTTFSPDGKVVTDFGSSDDFAWSVAIQRDGKIVTAGVVGSGPSTDFALARYLVR